MNDTLPKSNPSPPPSGSMAKEIGPHISIAEAPIITEFGQEAPLPSEVIKAGVTIKPTTIHLPPSVKNMGMKAVGTEAPAVGDTKEVALPLSDEQIARGLHESIQSSFRWLAQWCERQLKQAHIMVKTIHGKIIRSKE